KFCGALTGALERYAADMEFTALILTLPGESDMAREIANDVDPQAIYQARTALRQALGAVQMDRLQRMYDHAASLSSEVFDPANSGPRAIKAASLALIAAADPAVGTMLATNQRAHANTMTDRISALNTLGQIGGESADRAFAEFYTEHADDALVVDKWFSLQAM
ncbi:MAG: aminopeptidase N C-terminal domain-containing protein, partial [Beijerinckiaceae bacterium]|nr:aminopeptidase N C-terminal domain-containing protein [Beijerinckiaceae bacterium]